MARFVRTLLVFGAATVAVAVAPQAASASRAPSAAESKAILAATSIDAACARIRISTKAGGWAAVRDRGGRRCGQQRLVVLRRSANGAWVDKVTLGGSGPGYCPVEHVPGRVALDLLACKAPPSLAKAGAVMLCMEAAADINVLESQRAPKDCKTRLEQTPEEIADGLADGIEPEPVEPGANLSGLTWERWGSRRATAVGVDLGDEPTATATAVTVVATRPRFNECGTYTYTQVIITYPDGRTTQVKRPARCVI